MNDPLSLSISRPLEPVMELAELDAQIAATLSESKVSLRTDSSVSDQASRLRALVEGETGGVAALTAWSELAGVSIQAAVTREIETQADGIKPPFTIAVASGKGGVGKTNVAVNLAVGLAAAGYRATLLDADLGTANADVICGVSPVARLDHVIGPGGLGVHDGARRTIRDILVDAPGGFRLVPGSAGIARMADLTTQERRHLLDLMSELSRDTDVLVIDTAAGVGRAVTSLVNSADMCVVVCTPEPTAVTDAYALIKCAIAGEHSHSCDSNRFQLVINQVEDAAEARRVHARIRAVCDRFLGIDMPMLGWIAQDVRVCEAVRARIPLLVRSPQAEASRNISALCATIAQQVGPPTGRSCEKAPKRRLAHALRRLLGAT